MYEPTTQADVDTILPLRDEAIAALSRYIEQAAVLGVKVAIDRVRAQGGPAGAALLKQAAEVLDAELRGQIIDAAYQGADSRITAQGLSEDALALVLGR